MSYAADAILDVRRGLLAFCKFLSANDTGDTGTHQAGIHINKNAISILFEYPGQRGENMDRLVEITWQDDFTTTSRFIYYGVATRNEYRITRFGKGFPFLTTEHTGDLFVLIKMGPDNYRAYVLSTEDEINDFLEEFGMSPTNTGSLIARNGITTAAQVELEISRYIESLTIDFPTTSQMSEMARMIHHRVYNHEEDIRLNPDKEIVLYTDMEYTLFKKLESFRHHDMIMRGFANIDQFVEASNTILNRRKSRAGKSLEHHLSAIFIGNGLEFEEQAVTEGNKRPDFLFPNAMSYRNYDWPANKLVVLGAKTTCKDRWRQVINEANRVPVKHLFTLQQGISAQQLAEMRDERVTLVVPRTYIDTFPQNGRENIWTLKHFIDYVTETMSR